MTTITDAILPPQHPQGSAKTKTRSLDIARQVLGFSGIVYTALMLARKTAKVVEEGSKHLHGAQSAIPAASTVLGGMLFLSAIPLTISVFEMGHLSYEMGRGAYESVKTRTFQPKVAWASVAFVAVAGVAVGSASDILFGLMAVSHKIHGVAIVVISAYAGLVTGGVLELAGVVICIMGAINCHSIASKIQQGLNNTWKNGANIKIAKNTLNQISAVPQQYGDKIYESLFGAFTGKQKELMRDISNHEMTNLTKVDNVLTNAKRIAKINRNLWIASMLILSVSVGGLMVLAFGGTALSPVGWGILALTAAASLSATAYGRWMSWRYTKFLKRTLFEIVNLPPPPLQIEEVITSVRNRGTE